MSCGEPNTVRNFNLKSCVQVDFKPVEKWVDPIGNRMDSFACLPEAQNPAATLDDAGDCVLDAYTELAQGGCPIRRANFCGDAGKPVTVYKSH